MSLSSPTAAPSGASAGLSGAGELWWMYAEGATPHGRRRLFWKLQVGGWGAAALLGILFTGFDFFPWQEALIFGLLRAAAGFALTSLLRYFYRHLRRRRSPLWLVVLSGSVLCCLLGVGDAVGIALVGRAVGINLESSGMSEMLVASVLLRWILYGFWSFLYFGVNYWLDTEGARLRLAEAETATRAVELQLLRAQINPHFLFNALNSILAESGNPGSVRSLTLALSEYLRFSLQQGSDWQRLGVELEALENYLKVEKARFEENLEYSLQADEATRQTVAPAALMQPLVDNALKYGQCSTLRPVRIAVRAEASEGVLLITVSNSGEWLASHDRPSTGTGLANLRRRLQLLYGERASLTTRAGEGEVCVQVRVEKGGPR
ncbi:MAG TPA: histidine kinase [Chthoniobacteraceae bacterium]|nr:histidine kinase [Chthoniobacteraceae bacterium]